jgi:hypothetical protein
LSGDVFSIPVPDATVCSFGCDWLPVTAVSVDTADGVLSVDDFGVVDALALDVGVGVGNETLLDKAEIAPSANALTVSKPLIVSTTDFKLSNPVRPDNADVNVTKEVANEVAPTLATLVAEPNAINPGADNNNKGAEINKDAPNAIRLDAAANMPV